MTDRKPAKPRDRRKAAIIWPHDGTPGTPGYYRVRLGKGKPFVPVALRHAPPPDPETGAPLDRSYVWSLEIAGVLAAPPSVSHRAAFGGYADGMFGLLGEPIDEALYCYMLRVREWAVSEAPDAPEANPDQPVDLDQLPSLF